MRSSIFTTAAFGLLFGSAAHATLTVSVTDDGVPVALTITNPGGNLTATGTDANFSAIGVTATGVPAVPSPELGTTTLDVHNSSAGAHVLDVLVTQTGLSLSAGFASATDNTFNGLLGSPGPIVQTMFINGVALNSATFPASSGTATQNFTNVIGVPITSNAEEFSMTFAAPAAALETMSFVAAPAAVSEPSSLAMFGGALLSLGLGWRWARRARSDR